MFACLPLTFCSLPCPQQTSSPLSSSLTTHLPWPLLEAGAVQGRASGGGARPEMVPIQCKRTSCTPCPLPFFFSLPPCHPLSPFFLFLRTLVRSLCAACACVRACVRACWCSGRIVSAAGVRAFDPPCLCVCVCAFPRDVFCVLGMPCSAFITVYSCLFCFCFWCVLLQPGCCRHVQGR